MSEGWSEDNVPDIIREESTVTVTTLLAAEQLTPFAELIANLLNTVVTNKELESNTNPVAPVILLKVSVPVLDCHW